MNKLTGSRAYDDSEIGHSQSPEKVKSKYRSEKNLNSYAKMNAFYPSAEEIEKELLRQIVKTNRTIEQVNALLPPTSALNGSHNIQQLRSMEESIRRKDLVIKQIEQQIKMLKNGTYYEKSSKNNELPRLDFELKRKREILAKAHGVLADRIQQLSKKRLQMKIVQEKFQQKCEKEGVELITLDEFKEIEKKKRKEQRRIEGLKKSSKKQVSSIKQIHYSNKNIEPGACNDMKKMKDLLNKKNVAETALKTAKKKHMLEMSDLTGKLQFLRDELHEMEQKLTSKQKELRLAENRFSDSRSSSDKKILIRRYKTERNL